MHYQRTHSTSSMVPSERSISSGSSNASPPPNLVSLPSMKYSLADLPNMSAVPYNMMHNAAAHNKAKVGFFRARWCAYSFLSDGVRNTETKATGITTRRAQRKSCLCVSGACVEWCFEGVRGATLAQSRAGRGCADHGSTTAKCKTSQCMFGYFLLPREF